MRATVSSGLLAAALLASPARSGGDFAAAQLPAPTAVGSADVTSGRGIGDPYYPADGNRGYNARFFSAMREIQRQHAAGHMSILDLRDALEHKTGVDLTIFWRPWVLGTDRPAPANLSRRPLGRADDFRADDRIEVGLQIFE